MSQKLIKKETYSGNGHFYIEGIGCDSIGTLFTEWLAKLEAEHDVKVNNAVYSYHLTTEK